MEAVRLWAVEMGSIQIFEAIDGSSSENRHQRRVASDIITSKGDVSEAGSQQRDINLSAASDDSLTVH